MKERECAFGKDRRRNMEWIAQANTEPVVPRGLDFHCETALTQARMADRNRADLLKGGCVPEHCADCEKAMTAMQAHLASVIEQLEEMVAKLKAAKETA